MVDMEVIENIEKEVRNILVDGSIEFMTSNIEEIKEILNEYLKILNMPLINSNEDLINYNKYDKSIVFNYGDEGSSDGKKHYKVLIFARIFDYHMPNLKELSKVRQKFKPNLGHVEFSVYYLPEHPDEFYNFSAPNVMHIQ
jgi:hypothetical protein